MQMWPLWASPGTRAGRPILYSVIILERQLLWLLLCDEESELVNFYLDHLFLPTNIYEILQHWLKSLRWWSLNSHLEKSECTSPWNILSCQLRNIPVSWCNLNTTDWPTMAWGCPVSNYFIAKPPQKIEAVVNLAGSGLASLLLQSPKKFNWRSSRVFLKAGRRVCS